jgi:DNA polymerase V
MEYEKGGKVYVVIDLKSFYASVECRERGLDPLKTNLVVADPTRTEKTICLAVTPSLKAYGIPGRARLFEVVQKINKVNAEKNTAIANATASVSEFMASVAANESNSDSYYYYKYLDALTKAYGKNNLILVGDGVDSSKFYFGNFVAGSIGNSGVVNDTNTAN